MSNPFEIIEAKLDSILLALEPQSAQKTKPEKPISQTEAVKFMGVSVQTLINWRRQGLINAHHISGRIFYLPSELIAALEKKN